VGPNELLMVLDEDALDRLRGTFRVRHVASPRLVVVERTPAAVAAAEHGVDGVVAVSDGELPQALMDRLGPEEQLFAGAWASRMTGAEKEREGEGLTWDAPGFDPPDPPQDP
jgi:hypothetical protein